MSTTSEPNWDLLPFDPVSFFELEEGFDRKSLKRKYNALIKRYKPEKAPEEFQKIRAAFEALDGQLRYGQAAVSAPAIDTYQWKQDDRQTHETPLSSDSEKAPEAKQETLVERLSYQQPASIYKELSQKKAKSPYDFYVLALLSDIVTQDKSMFVKWILTGLQEHKFERGLISILCEYFMEDLESASIAPLLLTTSKLIPDDRFYFVTEKLWEQLLRKCGFSDFRKTLERCEANLRDFRIECRLTFYIFVIRKAMWKADKSWLDAAFELIDEHHQEIPEALGYDVDVLYMLREYLELHQKIIGNHSVRKQIHQAIVGYFSLPEKDGDRHFIRCQTLLSQRGGDLLDAFPSLDDDCEKLFIPWHMIHQEVSERHQLEEETNQRKLRNSVYELCQDLDSSNQFNSGHLFQYHLLSKGPYVLLFALPFALLWSWLNSGFMVGLSFFLAVGSTIAGHFYLKPHELFAKSMQRKVKRMYSKNWRARFIQILEATKADHEELAGAMIDVIQQKHHQLGLSTWLYEHVPVDIGLAFFAITTKYTK